MTTREPSSFQRVYASTFESRFSEPIVPAAIHRIIYIGNAGGFGNALSCSFSPVAGINGQAVSVKFDPSNLFKRPLKRRPNR
jgi:hypothetical protein